MSGREGQYLGEIIRRRRFQNLKLKLLVMSEITLPPTTASSTNGALFFALQTLGAQNTVKKTRAASWKLLVWGESNFFSAFSVSFLELL